MFTRRPVTVVILAMALLAGCAPGAAGPTPLPPAASSTAAATEEPSPTDAATEDPAPSEEPTDEPEATDEPTQEPEPSPSEAATQAPTPEPSPTAAAVSEQCQAANLTGLKNAGRLTLSTDNPAFPPWWGGDPDTQYPGEPEGGSGWELSDPYSGEGYEAAVAYAVAEALGFTQETVDWVQNVQFELAFAPGDKPFDFHLAQISIRPRRAEAVDFSEPYFEANQAVLALFGTPINGATTVEALKEFRLGAAQGTTSFQLIEEVVAPNVDPSVFNDNSVALQALQNGQIDGLVVDLNTALFMRDAQLEDFDTPDPEGIVVGQFEEQVEGDRMGLVLELDSPLTDCVNEAVTLISENGTLDAIYDEWISTGQDIPFFE
ncbi:MAG: transporter substrate-binding domain-containing protein [Chloroflexota bacterium]|nr:transporter substrate-binding domain-containing protein [Chloroflexota bacterium]